MSSKICTLCKEVKPLSEFGKHRITTDGLSHWCKECNRKRHQEYRKTPRGIYTSLKGQAKFWKRPPETLSREEFIEWYLAQEKRCVYCGINEEELSEVRDSINNVVFRLTVDRKDSNRGYSLENIILSCRRCNYVKNDFFTVDEMCEIGRKYITPKWKKMLEE